MQKKECIQTEDYSVNLEVFENNEDLVLFTPLEDSDCKLELPDPIVDLEKEIGRRKPNLKILEKANKHLEVVKSKNIISELLNDDLFTTKRPSTNIENRIESTLNHLIEQKIQTKALPLALRKRLMYQRSIAS